jgi:hypothetical protein
MKNCPNCGAVIDPYRVKCEYCGTMYFDWATWLQEGQPCFINYGFNYYGRKASIMTQAIPHLEVVEVDNNNTYAKDRYGRPIVVCSNRSCDLHVVFSCVADQRDKSLFKIAVEEE